MIRNFYNEYDFPAKDDRFGDLRIYVRRVNGDTGIHRKTHQGEALLI
jgi:hypothetical protein